MPANDIVAAAEKNRDYYSEIIACLLFVYNKLECRAIELKILLENEKCTCYYYFQLLDEDGEKWVQGSGTDITNFLIEELVRCRGNKSHLWKIFPSTNIKE